VNKKLLFVTYGSGHVRMILPVAKAVQDGGLAQVQVLGLTTAAPLVREAGLALLQFKDFVGAQDEVALAHGQRLLDAMTGPVIDARETQAYLGLCYAELVETVGPEQAAAMYARDARQAFLPVRTLERILRQVAPDLVVATNSPRAERAAITAAGRLGLPSVCLVDLFGIDEVKWLGAAAYASQVCVLNESVKRFLLAAGRRDDEISVTGNPAFDALFDPLQLAAGRRLRHQQGWDDKRVLLWPTQVEPAYHPFNGRPGDSDLPRQALQCVIDWVLSRHDSILCIRPRAGEAMPSLPQDDRIVVTGQDISLPALLHASDLVVTLNSTVGLEGHLAGTRVVQVLGSVFDDAMPLLAYGIADAAVSLKGIAGALAQWSQAPRKPSGRQALATERVLEVIRGFL
jgi:hypothetical protein